MSRISPALVVLIAVASAHPIGAVDKVIEINQAEATAGGVTPGADPAGFPVTLALPGHYRLTSNLAVPSGVGIDITADNVVLDLNGYLVQCIAAVDPCTVGIQAPAPRQNVVVRNGTVNGFSAAGLALGNYSVAEKVSAIGNRDGGVGVTVNIASVIRDCVITANSNGIHTGNGSLIESNLVADNLTGLCSIPGTTSAIRGNVITENPTANFCPGSAWFNAGGNFCGLPCPP
jgi:hypothetical protein